MNCLWTTHFERGETRETVHCWYCSSWWDLYCPLEWNNQNQLLICTSLYLHLSVKGYGKAPTHFYPSYAPNILCPGWPCWEAASPGWSAWLSLSRHFSHHQETNTGESKQRCRGGSLLRLWDNWPYSSFVIILSWYVTGSHGGAPAGASLSSLAATC